MVMGGVMALLALAAGAEGSAAGPQGAQRATLGAVSRLETQATEVLRHARAARWLEAVAAARNLEAQAAVRAPLEVFDAQVMGTPARGLGMYTPLVDGRVVGAELFLYAQVRNHQVRAVAGWHEVHLVSDLIILDTQGRELARDEAFGASRFRSRARHRDTFINAAVRIHGLPTGSYRARLVIHDRVGGKTGQTEVDFRIP